METTTHYAGFWMRFLAALIDGVLLSIVNTVIMTPLLGQTFMMAVDAGDGSLTGFDIIGWLTTFIVSYITIIVAGWLYYALMESSSMQATLGKKVLNLKVTDMNGERISFGKATGRYFGKILSSLILAIGYIMAAFTEKKQALHDILAGCLVVGK